MTPPREIKRFLAVAIIAPTAGFVILVLGCALVLVGEFAVFNETLYSSNFSWWRFAAIEPGRDRESVVKVLGAPLDVNAQWGCAHPNKSEPDCVADLWAAPKAGYGYFAQIDFISDKVVKSRYWIDD